MFLEQIHTEELAHSGRYLCVERVICPGGPHPGCCEFCSGDCEDQFILLINTMDGTVVRLGYHEAKKFYAAIKGRRERISFWHALQAAKWRERKVA